MTTAQAAAELPGIEAIRKIAAGELPPPPIASLLDFEITLVEPGRVIFAISPRSGCTTRSAPCTAASRRRCWTPSLGCAIHTVLPAGARYTTTDLHVRYVRGMTAETGRVLADSRVVHAGRKLATAEGRLYAEADRAAVRARHHELPDSLSAVLRAVNCGSNGRSRCRLIATSRP